MALMVKCRRAGPRGWGGPALSRRGARQGFDELAGALVAQLGVDAVLGRGVFDALARGDARGFGPAFGGVGVRALVGRALAEELVNQAFDHANNRRMRQPRDCATASSSGLGLVATGSVARSSRGRSLGESL